MTLPATAGGTVAFYHPHLRAGGAERVFLQLAHGLAGVGYDTCFVLDRREGEFLSEVRRPVHVLEASRTLASVPRLAGWLRKNRPCVLISAVTYTNMAAIIARRLSRASTAVVASEHTLFRRQATMSWKYRLTPLLARLIYPAADAIVTVSEAGRRDLEAALAPRACQIDMLPNPVVGDDFVARARAPLHHPWLGDDRTAPVVLAVGRLEPVKDFGLLLEAFAKVVARKPARLIVLGEGSERPALEARRCALGLDSVVDLPGVTTNPLPWFARANAVVLSSRYEGFGLVLVEAMACGVPVVSTEAGGPPAEIIDGLGPVVPSGDAAALAEAILNVLDHPAPAGALKRRAAGFSVASSVAAYARLIDRLSRPSGH
jgi:glycosyltransferase involved in cell wall biosynthesis